MLCVPYYPFLAWGQQFYQYTTTLHGYDKITKQIAAHEKELDEKNEKISSLQSIIDTIDKNNYIGMFEREI